MAVISFDIDEKIYRRFRAELMANDENMNTVMVDLVQRYIEESLRGEVTNGSAINSLFVKPIRTQRREKVGIEGKANRKIPVWIARKNVPYKIIRAYLMLEENSNEPVLLSDLEELCTSGREISVFVKNFKPNFAQMKFDGEKSHGKVFVVDEDRVYLDGGVTNTVGHYKLQFLE